MSVVVAIKENKKVYIGADSQVTRGGTRRTLRNPNNYKVWKIKGVENCLMAHVGNLREANVVRLMDGLVSEYNIYKNHIDFEFIVKKIVPEIFDELKNYGFLKDNKYIESIDSRFLFAYKDQLYLINKLFNNKEIRTVWNKDEEKYYISVVDIIEELTGSNRPRNIGVI